MWLISTPRKLKVKSLKLKVKRRSTSRKSTKLEWENAPDVKRKLDEVIKVLELDYIKPDRVFCYRTDGSRARAYARTWMMPKIFQSALDVPPAYVIEVITKYYDKLSDDDKTKVIIHELLHIPKNFSGALLSHHGVKRHIARDSTTLFKEYKKRGGI
jgi:predicted metallopeptidase